MIRLAQESYTRGCIFWLPGAPVRDSTRAVTDLIRDRTGRGIYADTDAASGLTVRQSAIGLRAWRTSTSGVGLGMPALTFPDNAGTFACWMKNDSGNINSPFGVGAGPQENHYPYSDNILYLDVLRSTRVSCGNNSAFDKTRWHHFCVTTKNGGDWTVYQNGIKFFSTSAEATVGWSGDAEMGPNIATGGNIYSGVWADPAVWDRELGPGEVRAIASHPYAMYDIPSLKAFKAPATFAGPLINRPLVTSLVNSGLVS